MINISVNTEVKNFKEMLFAEAKRQGFKDCEFFYSVNNSFQAKVFKGEMSEYKNASLKSFSFRGRYDGKMAYFSSEILDSNTIPFMIRSAIENSKILEEADQEELYPGDEKYPEIKTYFEQLDEITTEEKINRAKLMECAAYGADSRVVSVDYCSAITATSEIYISNSIGLNLHQKSNYAVGYVSARVKENDQTKVAMETWGGTDWEEFNPQEVAKKAVTKAISSLGAESVKSDKYTVIFENSAAADLFQTFTGIFYADNVQRGFSLLKDKINEKVASDVLTINDDIDLKNSIGNTRFDSEGVATANKTVVENGTLKTYLHNLKTAKKDGVKPTGNGFKHTIKSPIEISVNNFYIVPSENTLEDLKKMMGEGIMITGLSGLHSGANTVSGDFSLSASGHLIKDGEIDRAVEQITVSGNFFELLKNIEAVGDDLYFGIGTIGSPSLIVKKLDISGEE